MATRNRDGKSRPPVRREVDQGAWRFGSRALRPAMYIGSPARRLAPPGVGSVDNSVDEAMQASRRSERHGSRDNSVTVVDNAGHSGHARHGKTPARKLCYRAARRREIRSESYKVSAIHGSACPSSTPFRTCSNSKSSAMARLGAELRKGKPVSKLKQREDAQKPARK